jgi:hypothetical protein
MGYGDAGVCPECGSYNYEYSDGLYDCIDCGIQTLKEDFIHKDRKKESKIDPDDKVDQAIAELVGLLELINFNFEFDQITQDNIDSAIAKYRKGE